MSTDSVTIKQSILFLGTQMAIGGAQKVLIAQANWFHSQGYSVYVAFFYDKENLERQWRANNPFPVIDLRAWREGAHPIINGFYLVLGLIRLWCLLYRKKVEIIETFTPDSNLLGMIVSWLAGVKVRIATHHGVIEKRSHWLMRLNAQFINRGFAHTLVAVSEQVRQIAISEEGVNPAKVEVILNGIELQKPRLTSSEARACLRAELNFSPEKAIILSVGRLTLQKGYSYLLDAAVDVLANCPNTVFLIVGDGQLRKSLVEKASFLGIKPSVFFLGTRDDVAELLVAADLFVMPSISEGMPIALLEAMGQGIPVVVSKLDQISAFVQHKEHGLLVEPHDVNALSTAIISMLQNKSCREKYGKAAQRLVQEQYTLERMCRQYELLFFRENWDDSK